MRIEDSARNDLGEWVSYFREIGVRDVRRAGAADLPSAPRPTPERVSEPAPGTAGAADAAARLAELRAEIGDCTRCKLHAGRTKLVFGVGNPQAKIFFVGEGPGEQEDLKGEPFVGRAGQKLDEMLTRGIGVRRQDVYIANIVKCRPPKNREPEPDEVATCSAFLFAQIEAIRPRVIVCLGRPATHTLLSTREGITKLRGQWHNWRGIPVMPTFHPAYILRNPTPEVRRQAWEDLKAALARASE